MAVSEEAIDVATRIVKLKQQKYYQANKEKRIAYQQQYRERKKVDTKC